MFIGCQKYSNDNPGNPVNPGKTDYAIVLTFGEGGEAEVKVGGETVQRAAAGAVVVLTATENEEYEFGRWKMTGTSLADPTANPATFTMPAGDVSIVAEFDKNLTPKYSITVTAGAGGSAVATIDGVEVSKAAAGVEVTLTATEDEGYAFTEWIIIGGTLSDPAANPVTFTMPEANVVTEAKFADSRFYEKGAVVNGVKWATRNVDAPGTFAPTPESSGMYYHWGQKVGWSGGAPAVPSDGTSTWPAELFNESLAPWPAAADPCPTGWRLPTLDEQKTLKDRENVTQEAIGVTGEENEYGVLFSGSKYIDKTSDNSIYFPASGIMEQDGILYASIGGYYWSSTASNSSDHGKVLSVYNDATIVGNDHSMIFCSSVRCVAK
jgi:uncharacterized protein (TIGR02145 family)